ncbi:MAG: major tail protein [Lachnospiraceae bacterium]|nr:major tail protein [Lachnospiraceae bacterium]
MAYFGLSNPWIAKLDVKNKTYSGGFKNGTAVGTDVTPQYNEANLYGDNVLQESTKEFKYADVTLNTTHMPIEAANVMFGHKVDSDTKEITYNASDAANYVGYGFYASEKIDGKTTYIAAILPKVIFAEAAENYTTKGDSLEFKTPSVSGKAMPLEDGTWKVKKTFETEQEAVAFIKEYLNITDAA